MGVGTIFHGVMAVANFCTGNFVGALTEAGAAVQSYAVGEALAPIKEFVGESLAEADWVDIAETSPLW